MRQRGDQTLITLLNNVRTGNITNNDEKILQTKFMEKSDHNYYIRKLFTHGQKMLL